MINKLTPGIQSPASAADVLEEWTTDRQDGQEPFDANPRVQAAYRGLRAFLVGSRSRILPLLKDWKLGIDPLEFRDSPELMLGALFAEAMLEAAKDSAISGWYREYDVECRKAYSMIFPILRRASRATRANDNSVIAQCSFARDRWVYLELLNHSHQTLTNVSIHAQMETIDGRSSDHYYFFAKWRPMEDDDREGKKNVPTLDENLQAQEFAGRVPLRLAADWWPVRAEGTTCIRLEFISDEIKGNMTRFPLNDNIPVAADEAMDDVQSLLGTRRFPKALIGRLEKVRGAVGQDTARRERAERLLVIARQQLTDVTKNLDERIKKVREELADLDKPKSRRKGVPPPDPAPAQKRRAELTAELKKLTSEKNDWQNGRR